jgi:hypothetical protein
MTFSVCSSVGQLCQNVAGRNGTGKCVSLFGIVDWACKLKRGYGSEITLGRARRAAAE